MFMLCYEECKQTSILLLLLSLFVLKLAQHNKTYYTGSNTLLYVGPILKVISCLDYANVLLCNYAGIQVMILQND